MKRHLFLIGNYPPDAQWSMRLIADLAQQAAETGGWKVTRLAPTERCGQGHDTSSGKGKYLGYIDKYVLAPRMFRRAWADACRAGSPPDLVHIADHSNAIYSSCFKRTPVLVTCHDLIAVRRARGEFPGGRPGLTGRLQQQWILSSLKRAEHVAFDSAASREDFLRLTGSTLKTQPVIFPCLAQPLSRVPDVEARGILAKAGIKVRGRYLHHHGNSAWYKNREQVIRVFLEARRQHPDLELVCSGGPLTGEQKKELAAAGVMDSVHDAGGVSLEALQALYSSASVFLFPSWVEGFGWPPVEAQVCGCPVVASNGGSLAEVLGDSALVADPTDTATLHKHVVSILENPAVAENLRALGFANVERFNRSALETGYLQAYETVLNGAPVPVTAPPPRRMVAAG